MRKKKNSGVFILATMKIQPIKNAQEFRAGIVNINAFSDSHGQLDQGGAMYYDMQTNSNSVFLKEGAGKKNVLAISGDWFMAGNTKGYKTNPEYNNQKYQTIFLNKFIQNLRKFSPNMSVILSLGNHEFDAGEKDLVKSMQQVRGNVILTNANFENSSPLRKLAHQEKLTKSKVVEVQDDKDPKLKHKVLFVGVAPGNMCYYNKKIKNIEFSDNVKKPQSEILPQDVKNTIKAVEDEILGFKKENPNGAVVLMDHFAGTFFDEIAKKDLPIDVILGAHEHKDESFVLNNGTKVVKLSQNFQKYENIKIKFGDDGKIEDIKMKDYYPKDTDGTTALDKFYRKLFKKDLRTQYTIPAQEGLCELSLKGVRNSNSHLANYICDVIFHQIKKDYPQTDFFALNASAIRGPLKVGEKPINNTHLITILNGIKEEEATIVITKASGDEVLDIICENLAQNLVQPQKNPLYQFSGLKINKTAILEGMDRCASKKDLIYFITLADTNEPLELDKTYNFANVEKFFIKGKTDIIKKLASEEFTLKTDINAKKAFIEFFDSGEYTQVVAKKEERYI